jgi:ABC-type nickel/cobalt efflux system permease component RcnA
MNNKLRNIIVFCLVGLGLLIYIYIFIEEMMNNPRTEGDAALQFAMSIGVSISTFIGALLGVDTKERIRIKRLMTLGEKPPASSPKPWYYNIQYVVIVIYMIILLVGVIKFMGTSGEVQTLFIQSIFTNATGLILGALAIVLSPIEG